jgi:short-subunit dehydrogenase
VIPATPAGPDTPAPVHGARPLRVFLTGASSGIGLALARHYAAQGAQLGLVARRAEALVAFAGECAQAYPQASIALLPADVCQAESMRAAAQTFIARFGGPDIVIANAGISIGVLTGCGDLDTFRAVMDTNYFGMVATFEPFIDTMSMARHGTLVGIGSVAGVRGLPGHGAYSASKAAAMRYLESLRVELRPAGISVVTIAPGYIRTPMTDPNPFPMPFLMDADRFAAQAAHAIERRVRFAVLPWPMRIVSALLHVMPRWLYDRIMQNAPRKPRAPQS